MKRPLLDTHIWVWWLLGDRRLRDRERQVLDTLPPGKRPLVCDISLWEVALLVQGGRLQLTMPFDDWITVASSPLTVDVRPITPSVVKEMNRLPARFHNDPADRLIVATARATGVPLATRDGRITRSRLVPLWRG